MIVRTTQDVDILIEPTLEDCRRVVAATATFHQQGAIKVVWIELLRVFTHFGTAHAKRLIYRKVFRMTFGCFVDATDCFVKLSCSGRSIVRSDLWVLWRSPPDYNACKTCAFADRV